MVFEGKNINDITEDDLQALLGISREHHNIDFKGDAYDKFKIPDEITNILDENKRKQKVKEETLKKENEKKAELCKDISAFANASGGWIICGMRDKEGIAHELIGLGSINGEEEEKRLESAAKDGIEPFPYGTLFRVIALKDRSKAFAIVIRIPSSYNSPHRVKSTGKFQVRRSNGNDEMTMDELRNQFTFAASFRERAKAFRKERIEAISVPGHEDVPALLEKEDLSMPNSPKKTVHVVLHIIPIFAYDIDKFTDLSIFNSDILSRPRWLLKHSNDLANGRYNIDGYVKTLGRGHGNAPVRGYTQIFRNGSIECVREYHLRPEGRVLELSGIEAIVLEESELAFDIQRNLINVPVAIMLSITNTKAYLFTSRRDSFPNPDIPLIPLQKTNLLVPEIYIEDIGKGNKVLLKDLFDMLWNVGSFPKSQSYDKDGNWIERRA